jgi:uncharacterized membrane protein YfcA
MSFKFLVHGLHGIISDPAKEWDTIQSENKSVKYIRWNLFFPLIILAAASAFLGSLLFTRVELSKVYPVLTGVKYFILIYLVIHGTAFIFKEITNAYGFGRDFNLSFKIIAYSSIPFLICQIISQIFESLIFINVLAFFGLYIFWTGVGKLLHPPEQKKLPLLIFSTVIFVILFLVTNWFLSKLFDKLYYVFIA